MKQTICDICRNVISGSFAKHTILINNGTVTFSIDHTAGEDLCYYCACEKAYEAAVQWRQLSYDSVEGKRRKKAAP